MIENATGLIVRTRPLTETSLIVQWLTAEQGRIATVAKGARRPKSAFQGKLDLFYLAELSFSRSRHSELHNLREVRVIETFSFLRKGIEGLRRACYCATLVEQTTESDTPLPGVLPLMQEYLMALAQGASNVHLLLAFELRLLNQLGMGPNLDDCRLLPADRELAHQLATGGLLALSKLQPDPESVRAVKRFLHGFLIYHLGRLPRGREAALATDPARCLG